MKRFQDYSLKKKLLYEMVAFMIVPLLIFGMAINLYVKKKAREAEYTSNQQLLQRIMNDFDTRLSNIKDIKYSCLTSFNFQKLLQGRGNGNDYSDVCNILDTARRSDESIGAITVIRDQNIVIQRGDYNFMEFDEDMIRNSYLDTQSGKWGTVERTPVAGNPQVPEADQISYYCGVNDYDNIHQNIAVLVVSLTEKGLAAQYTSYTNQDSVSTSLVSQDGIVLSSTEKDRLGMPYEELEKISSLIKDGKGYKKITYANTSCMVFVTRSRETGWYLINIIPVKKLGGEDMTGGLIILLVFFLCIVFSVFGNMLQQRYFVQPVQDLLTRIEAVKQGIFSKKKETYPKDEIGILAENFDEMSELLNQLINEVYRSRIQEQEARLNTLIAQLNPHFLFNTLDSIHWLAVKNKDYKVGEVLEILSELFRSVLSKEQALVSVESEIEFIRNYVEIMRFRFGDRIHLEIAVDQDARDRKIPKFMIQPLVENSILHGLEPKVSGGTIQLSILSREEYTEIVVMDDGIGFDVEKSVTEEAEVLDPDTKREHVLKNIDNRLKLRFGEENGIVIDSVPGEGTKVTIKIPAL